MSLVPHTGSRCLELVAEASECLKSNPKAAQNHLKLIKKETPTLLEQLRRRESELEQKQSELKREEDSLERQINDKEAAKEQHRREINELEAKKARNEASLNEARQQLSQAESNKRDAEKRKDGAVGGTVAGGVAAGILGVLFPPSLIVTVPAVAVAGTISISDANDAIDRCRGRISSIKGDISSERSRIQETNNKISGIQSDINALTSRQQTLYAERGQLRNGIVFLQKATTYFADLQVAVEGGDKKTDVLHRIVEKANKKQQYKIMDSAGFTTVANSFKDAWGRVEDKVMGGDRDGYLGIKFVELPQLE